MYLKFLRNKELGIHRSTLYQWRSNWRLQGDVVPASEKDPAGFNATELSSYCRERGLFLEQVDRWRQTAPTWPWPACRRHLMQMQTQC